MTSLPRRSTRQAESGTALFIDLGKGCAYVEGREIVLTQKELLTLATLHARGGNLCSKDELARQVWPEFEGAVDDESIEQVISRLRRKIEPDPQHPKYLLTARGLGYRLFARDVSEESTPPRPVWSPRIGRLALLASVIIVIAAASAVLLWVRVSRPNSTAPSVPAEAQRWTLIATEDFSDPEKTAFPRGAGSTLAGLVFTRGPEAGKYLIRVLKGPEGSGLTASGPQTSLESFAFEADATVTGSLQYGLALFWGAADALQLRINPLTGDFELFYSPEGTITKLERSPAVHLGSDTNRLMFEVSGPEVTVFINGTAVSALTLDFASRRPVSPGFHIFVPPGQEIVETSGTRAFFDNFRLFGSQ